MGRAIHDANAITTLIGVSSTDGETPLAAELTAATNRLRVDAIITSGPPAEYTEGDTDATISGGVLMFEGGGDTIYATSDIHPLPVDCTEVEDVDDDGIAISQVLPLKIVENYVMSKTDGAWVRQQASGDGYIFNTVMGTYDSDGHQLDVNTDGSINVIDNVANSLAPSNYDYIALTYTGDNLTGVVYKTGGVGGTTISTLTLAYTGDVLDSVTKT